MTVMKMALNFMLLASSYMSFLLFYFILLHTDHNDESFHTRLSAEYSNAAITITRTFSFVLSFTTILELLFFLFSVNLAVIAE